MGKIKKNAIIQEKKLISRDLYKKIKKFDHSEMEQFCSKLFHQGFEEGAKAGTEVDIITTIIQRLQGKKGFGDKTLEKIKKALETS